ncbi:MAG: hypothetical protein KDC26_12430 [Armatimonadetes bacterium]|nr:hypothetical protein [Armatimonadota bacterium]
MKRKMKKRGFTLMEVIVSSVMSTVVLFGVVSLLLMVMGSWARGEGRMDGENDARQAMRAMSDELREAMLVQVDADGMGLTYRKPAKNGAGDFTLPVAWDGVVRRLYYSNGSLWISDGATNRKIAKNVLTVDPFASASHRLNEERKVGATTGTAYKVFTPNPGAVITEVTMMVVISNKGGQSEETVRARKRETVVLRNVPEIIK